MQVTKFKVHSVAFSLVKLTSLNSTIRSKSVLINSRPVMFIKHSVAAQVTAN